MERRSSWHAGRLPVSNVDHVAFNVPDLDEAVEFFTHALGCEVVNRGGPVDYGDGLGVSYAFLRFDPSVSFELLKWRGPEVSDAMPGFTDNGGGHLALSVNDLDEAIAVLSRQPGIHVVGPQPIPDGRRFVRFLTAWGMTIQLLSRHSEVGST